MARLPVPEVGEGFEGGRAGRHLLGAELLQRQRVPGDVEQLVVPFLLPVLKRILVKQIEVLGDLRLPEHLFVLLRARADHPRHERGRGGQMVGRQRQSLRVEVIDGQVAVRMDDDGPRAFLDRRGVDAVAQPFLDDDGVTEVTLGLREQVADRHGLPRARHAEQHRVLRGAGCPCRAGEGLDADQVVGRPVVDRLGRGQVSGERARDRQHVRQETVLGVELPMFVASPRPARPGLEEQVLRRAGQVALEVLRRVHRVDGVLDRPGLGVEAVAGLVPDADGEHRVERNRLPLHQRVNLLLLLLHHGEQGDFLLAGVVAGHAVVLLFLLVDFLGDRERINIHRDGVVQQPQIGETLDDSRIRRARPAGQDDERVIVTIEEEAEIGLAVALAVPAVFLNRKFRRKPVRRVEVETVVQRRIQKPFVVPEMVEVGHRQDARAARAEDFQQQPVDVLELGFELVEQRVVIIAPGGGGSGTTSARSPASARCRR